MVTDHLIIKIDYSFVTTIKTMLQDILQWKIDHGQEVADYFSDRLFR